MKIETKRLQLISCDNESLQMMKEQNYKNGDQVENHVRKLAEDPTVDGWGSWLVLRKSDGLILGDAGFKGKPSSEKEVEVGYGFLELYWGMGYATEAVKGLLDWAVKTNGVEKIIAETNSHNTGSMRVLEKVGMKKTREHAGMIYWQLAEEH